MPVKTRLVFSFLVLHALVAVSCTTINPQPEPAADPMSDGAQNVKLVGHHDLQGRTALVVTTKSDLSNGNWVYVGHHENPAGLHESYFTICSSVAGCKHELNQ